MKGLFHAVILAQLTLSGISFQFDMIKEHDTGYEAETTIYIEDREYHLLENEKCECGQNILKMVTYTTWEMVGEKRCVHYPFGSDLVFESEKIETYLCPHCNKNWSERSFAQRLDCHGYAKS